MSTFKYINNIFLFFFNMYQTQKHTDRPTLNRLGAHAPTKI